MHDKSIADDMLPPKPEITSKREISDSNSTNISLSDPKKPVTKDTDESEILVLQNALLVMNKQYTKVKLELDELRDKEQAEQNKSTLGKASSFLKKHIQSKARRSRRPSGESEHTQSQNTTIIDQQQAMCGEKIRTQSNSISEDTITKPTMTDSLLTEQIFQQKDKLALVKEEVKRLTRVLEDRDETLGKLKAQSTRNAFEYEKKLQKARSDFERERLEQCDKYSSEKAALESELERSKEQFIQDLERTTKSKPAENMNENDDLITKARTRFQLQLKKMEDTHELAVKALKESKDRELEVVRAEMATVSAKLFSLKQEAAFRSSELKKKISDLRKKLDMEKKLNDTRKNTCPRSTPQLNKQSETPCQPTVSQSSSLTSLHKMPLIHSIETVQSLRQQVLNVQSTLELEKQNLFQALRKERGKDIASSDLKELVNSLTLEMIEKDRIIEKLKNSIAVGGRKLMKMKRKPDLNNLENNC